MYVPAATRIVSLFWDLPIAAAIVSQGVTGEEQLLASFPVVDTYQAKFSTCI
jgi:hypothetical protein